MKPLVCDGVVVVYNTHKDVPTYMRNITYKVSGEYFLPPISIRSERNARDLPPRTPAPARTEEGKDGVFRNEWTPTIQLV